MQVHKTLPSTLRLRDSRRTRSIVLQPKYRIFGSAQRDLKVELTSCIKVRKMGPYNTLLKLGLFFGSLFLIYIYLRGIQATT